MSKWLVVLCLFITGCTTIQQDAENNQAENAAREPSSCSGSADEEPNVFVRARAWDMSKAAFKAGICPELDQVAPSAWRIFAQFWEPSPERRTLPETLSKLLEGTRTTIRPLETDEARGAFANQTKALAVRGPQEYFLITTPKARTVLAIGPYHQPTRCREIQ